MYSPIMALSRSRTLSLFTKNCFKGRVAMPWLCSQFKTADNQIKSCHYSSMMSFESSLPRLPVPPLHQTMDKYLKVIEALVDKEEFENSRNIVKELSKPGGAGEMLQKELEGYAKTKDNWLSEWWKNKMLLDQRVPLPIYYSPVGTLSKEFFHNRLSHLKYAARVIANVLSFKEEIDNDTLSVDMMGKEPLNMSQYKNLFGGVRMPRDNRDEFIVTPSCEARHVVIAHNNQFYVFDVLDANGKPLSESELLTQLMQIVENSEPLEHPVGVLTSADRTFWANQRIELGQDKTNQENLDKISSAICVICFDKPPLKPTHAVHMEDVDNTISTMNGLHGGSVDVNGMNRWYDKTIHFLITEDGYNSSLFEHSPIDGPITARLWDHVLGNCEGYEAIIPSNPSSSNLPNLMKLKWNLSPATLEAIQTAKKQFQSIIDEVDLRCLKFQGYGKDFIKKQKLSPDAWIQIAFQLAHYRLHGRLGPNYETASLRKFYDGRTENIRSSSMATLHFVQAVDNQSVKVADKLDFMVQAIEGHSESTIKAMNAQGIDRHLFGLKEIAMELGLDLPDFFKDRVFEYFWHFTISTSQVPMSKECCVTFGPAVPDGYGICYNPRPDNVLFGLSTYKRNPVTNPDHFATTLERSLNTMRILATTSKN